MNRDLIETIKYGSKIFTELNPGNKSQKMSRKVYVAALYNIYSAMSGLRLFERFGFNLPETNSKDNNYSVLDNYEELVYYPQIADWINEDTGETLSGYVPEVELQNLLDERMDSELE